jgi:transcriptional regulator with XRE-family HTH domain
MPLTRRRFPNNLYALRRIRGFRQKTVATLLGQKGTDMVSCYERGLVLPPLSTVIKLTLILRAEVTELYPHMHKQLERELQELVATLPKGLRRPMIGRQKGDSDHDCFGKGRAIA